MAFDANQISLIFRWGAREETPKQIAERFVDLIDRLRLLCPSWNLWTSGPQRPLKFETFRNRYAEIIARGVVRDDWGGPEHYYGYGFFAITRSAPKDRFLSVGGTASNTLFRLTLPNNIKIETDNYIAPDFSFFTLELLKEILKAAVEAWSPVAGWLRTDGLTEKFQIGEQYFQQCWMLYLAPEPAAMITLPASAFIDRLANGGVIISATQNSFDLDDPIQMAAVNDIAVASAPLNKRWDAQYYFRPQPKDEGSHR